MKIAERKKKPDPSDSYFCISDYSYYFPRVINMGLTNRQKAARKRATTALHDGCGRFSAAPAPREPTRDTAASTRSSIGCNGQPLIWSHDDGWFGVESPSGSEGSSSGDDGGAAAGELPPMRRA